MKKKRDIIIVTLKKLADDNDGIILPKQVVEAARSIKSPLHSYFEWDDDKAAESYRIWQARQLLRVCVEYIKESKHPVEVFVSLTTDRRQGGYRIQTEVLSNSEMRRQLLADALSELELFRHKYFRLKELADVFKSIRRVLKR